jgi:urease accessory protein
MTRFFCTALVACLFASTTPALAHAPLMGIGGVFGGVIHALLVPEHGLTLLALGLVLGRQKQDARRLGMLLFVSILTCGLVAAALIGEDTLAAADLLLLATCSLGLLIAVTWMPPRLVLCLAAVAGLMFALDSKPDGTSATETARMLIGSGIGAAIALALVAEGAVHLRGHVLLIAARVAGSWIAAIGIMVLSLRIVTRMTIG